jgi:hypothetical protein
MSILTLLQLAITLLVSAQSPSVSVEIRQQALDFAKQTVEIASIQLQAMNTSSTPEATPAPTNSQPVNTQPSQVTQTQPTNDPVVGAAEPFSVTVTKVTALENGGEFYFTVDGKSGTPQKPELILDEVETNLRPGQVFYKMPPIEGMTNSYRLSIRSPQDLGGSYPQSSYLKVTIGGETVNVPINITQ